MKREITVDGKASDWFEKAVFTLKDEQVKSVPKDLFSYAEELVEKYLKRFPISREKDTILMKQEQETKKLVSSMKEAYDLQNQYTKLKQKERNLRSREKDIHLFFVLSISICIVSVVILMLTMIFG